MKIKLEIYRGNIIRAIYLFANGSAPLCSLIFYLLLGEWNKICTKYMHEISNILFYFCFSLEEENIK